MHLLHYTNSSIPYLAGDLLVANHRVWLWNWVRWVTVVWTFLTSPTWDNIKDSQEDDLLNNIKNGVIVVIYVIVILCVLI